MALVNILNVEILDNPAPFVNPVQMEITFECIAPLDDGTIISLAIIIAVDGGI